MACKFPWFFHHPPTRYRYLETITYFKKEKQGSLRSFRPLTRMDGACTDLYENLSVNSFKGDLSNATTFNPPLFSLVNTFKSLFLFYSCIALSIYLRPRYIIFITRRRRRQYVAEPVLMLFGALANRYWLWSLLRFIEDTLSSIRGRMFRLPWGTVPAYTVIVSCELVLKLAIGPSSV